MTNKGYRTVVYVTELGVSGVGESCVMLTPSPTSKPNLTIVQEI